MTSNPENRQQSNDFPLVDIAMTFLQKGSNEPYRFSDAAPRALDLALEAMFLRRKNNHDASLGELMRLACALQEKLDSPAAASVIASALFRSPRALKRIRARRSAEEARFKAMARYQSEKPKSAPQIGVPAPAGTLKASSLLEPSRRPGLAPPRRFSSVRDGGRTKH